MPLLWAAALGAAQPYGASLTKGGLRYHRLPPVAELRGPAAWQAAPSGAVYRRACHQVLPWLLATFAMVSDAAWLGKDQWPWSTAPAIGAVGRLGGPSASNAGGVDRCVLSL